MYVINENKIKLMMIKRLSIAIFSLLVLTACGTDEPKATYKYELNPKYGYGYAEFFGAWNADYNNPNNVIAISLFTDSLSITDEGDLAGLGQFLFIENIFVPNTYNYLVDGTYTASESEAPFTFLPGKKFDVDGFLIDTGAFMLYLEKNNNFSTQKFISRGTFTVAITDVMHKIDFDLVLSDSSKVKGSFNDTLPHINSSISRALNVPKKLTQKYFKK